ncbi:MAG: hypothetical protein KAT15_02370 [Bacteroidales bacterium]|nr:hypothetical protein [Bacteroidales bacterium]
MRTRFKIAFCIAMISGGIIPASAQDQSILEYLAECERKYGDDLDLVNGEKYFYPYSNTEGDPFLDKSSQAAEILIKGKSFEGQQIRYDIYNQQLVLEYEDIYGGLSSLVLRSEWVEQFHDGYRQFKAINGPDGSQGFYQQIHEGDVSCYYRWRKEYLLNLASGVRSYYFTEPVRDAYIVLDEEFHQFRNNRSLVKIFQKDRQKEVKLYLRQNGMNVKRSADWQMHELLEHINTVLNETK